MIRKVIKQIYDKAKAANQLYNEHNGLGIEIEKC